MKMASGGSSASRIIGWLFVLIVIIGAAAAFFTFNFDEYVKYHYYKLTYKVTDDPSASVFSECYIRASGSVCVSMDIRVFTLMAFLEGVAGYKTEHGLVKSDARLRLEADMASKLATVPSSRVSRWKSYYDAHPYNVFTYMNYVLALGRPPEFRYIVPKSLIVGTEFFMLGKFREILGDFFITVRIDELYAWHRDAGYFMPADKYDLGKLADELAFANRFMRIEQTKASKITLHIIPMPYESHYTGYSVTYGDDVYIIEGPGTFEGTLNWHEYAHSVVSPAVRNTVWAYSKKFSKVLQENAKMPMIRGNYEKLDSYVTENIVRAIDHKMQIAFAPSWAKDSLRRKLAEVEKKAVLDGFVLIPYFSEQLDSFIAESAMDIASFVKKALASY